MEYETLEVRREDAVLWCTLNRPDSLNAMNPQLVTELRDLLSELADDNVTRVVVLRGAGRAFCAGLDLKEMGSMQRPGEAPGIPTMLRVQRRIAEIALMMRRLPQVFVAGVQGAACGGGFMLALASDIRIATENARMNAAFIKIGLSGCDVGTSYLLPRLIGASLAAELILTGRFIDAPRAERLGLVSAVVPADQLEAELRGLVDELLATTPLGLRLSKECLNASLDMNSMEAVVAMEDRNQVLCAQTGDFRESLQAFREKRPAKFHDA
ncbi:MAG: enoyl-CoA hydratase-related protein [Deltaproteobacteria bacterium]